MKPNATPTPTTNTFREFAAESLGLFTKLEQLAAGWGLGCGIGEFADVGLSSGNASALYLSGGSAAEFGLKTPTALVSLEAVCREQLSCYWRDLLVSIVCHELAHHTVDLFERQRGRDPVCVPKATMQRVLLMTECEVVAVYNACDCPPWSNHALEFHRAAAHISHRLAAAGFWAPAHFVIPSCYGLSLSSWYFDCFRDELVELADRPITEVLQAPVPAAAVQLFEGDVARWCRQQQQRQQQRQAQSTTERDNTHVRENSQTRENSEAQGPPGRLKRKDDSPEDPLSQQMIPRNLPT